MKIFSNILLYKDTYNSIFRISGERCWLFAQYINGAITAEVSLSILDKPLVIDFVPMSSFSKKQMMWLEIQRLHLDFKKKADGKYRIVLDAMSEDTAPKNDYNLFQTRSVLLAKLDGSPKQYTRVDLKKHRKIAKTESEINIIEEY